MTRTKTIASAAESASPPTIYEVADRAQVSIKTVSRVLNGEPNVRPEMQARVLAAVSDLGYRPKTSARGLAGARSFTLVTFLDERLTLEHWRGGRDNPYVERLQFAAMMQCREDGYHLLVELLDPEASTAERAIQSTLAAISPDGIILTPPISESAAVMDILARARAPFVRLSAASSKAACLSICMDETAAAADAVDHLLELGHTRIGFVSGAPGFASSALREAGYKKALAKRSVAFDPKLVATGDYNFESGKAAAASFLAMRRPPTAIFASNDEMALGAIHEATRRGFSAPRDLSVVGFDDFPAAQYSIPPLTTIRQPVGEMSAVAVKRLIENAKKRASQPDAERILVPHRLVVRASTCPPSR